MCDYPSFCHALRHPTRQQMRSYPEDRDTQANTLQSECTMKSGTNLQMCQGNEHPQQSAPSPLSSSNTSSLSSTASPSSKHDASAHSGRTVSPEALQIYVEPYFYPKRTQHLLPSPLRSTSKFSPQHQQITLDTRARESCRSPKSPRFPLHSRQEVWTCIP